MRHIITHFASQEQAHRDAEAKTRWESVHDGPSCGPSLTLVSDIADGVRQTPAVLLCLRYQWRPSAVPDLEEALLGPHASIGASPAVDPMNLPGRPALLQIP
jgi:hypothetical protein